MAIPVISVTKNGLPVSAAAAPYGYPVTVSTNGFGLAVMPVASGGLPVFDTSGTLFGAAVIPANLTVPVISGTAQVGQTLATTSGTWSGSAATYTYQWKRGGTNISGATLSVYLLVSADNGANITITVTATNTAGSANATSAAVGPVVLGPPVNITLPVISGATVTGSTVTTTDGTWIGSPQITYIYQWFKDGSVMGGASANNYLIMPYDLGSMLTVTVKATNSFGFLTVVANSVGPVTVGGTAPATPVLIWTSDATDLTPEGTVTFDNVPVAGDGITSQIATAGTSFSSPIINVAHTITGPEDIANTVSLASTPLAPGNYDWRVKVTHAGVDSAWSNTETKVVTGFNPGMLTPALWFEVGKGGMFQSNAGTTPATANGNVVAYLPDQSSNAFHLTGATAGVAPTDAPVLGGIGTFPYLDFDGVNDYLRRMANIGSITGGAFTWAIVYRSNSNAVSTRLMAEGGTTAIQSLDASTSPATSSSGFWRNDASGAPTGGPTGANYLQANAFNGTDRVLMVSWDGTTLRYYLDGVAGPTGTVTALGTFTPTAFAIAALQRAAAGSWWKGRIYGGAVINRVITSTERANLLTYLGNLAGLSL